MFDNVEETGTVQSGAITRSDFNAAIGIRDFHMKRINRFLKNRALNGEDSSSLVKSLTILDTLADFLGDNVRPILPQYLFMLACSAGYRQRV